MNQERKIELKGCCCGCIIPFIGFVAAISLSGAYGIYKVINNETPFKTLFQTLNRENPPGYKIIPITQEEAYKQFISTK